jgi:hypothetical protein
MCCDVLYRSVSYYIMMGEKKEMMGEERARINSFLLSIFKYRKIFFLSFSHYFGREGSGWGVDVRKGRVGWTGGLE